MNTQLTIFNYCKGIDFFIDNGKISVRYDIKTLMSLSEKERKEVEQSIKSYVVNNGMIEQ